MKTFTKLSIGISSMLMFAFTIVPGVSAATMTPWYSKGPAMWQGVSGARWYNIYYMDSTDKRYTHAVRNLPWNASSYTIGYLKRGHTYWYNVAAVNDAGREFSWSGNKKLMTSPM